MAGARMVDDLGRPETAQETADRKAESSRIYRASQTTRNLVAALIVTLAMVAVIVLIVPRGDSAPRGPIDVAAVAQQVEQARGIDVVVPTVPADWAVNGAAVEGDNVEAWTIVYAPAGETGFVRVAQGLGADDTWAAQMLRGAAPRGTVTINGVTWDRYEMSDPSAAGNVSAALGVQAGDDHILIYGTTSDDNLTLVASSIADHVRDLEGGAQ